MNIWMLLDTKQLHKGKDFHIYYGGQQVAADVSRRNAVKTDVPPLDVAKNPVDCVLRLSTGVTPPTSWERMCYMCSVAKKTQKKKGG